MSEITIIDNADSIDDLEETLKALANSTRLRILFIINDLENQEKKDFARINKRFFENCKTNLDNESLEKFEENKEEFFEYLKYINQLTNNPDMPYNTEIIRDIEELFSISISSDLITNYKKNLEEYKQTIDTKCLIDELVKRYNYGLVEQNLRNHLKILVDQGFLEVEEDFVTRSVKGLRKVNAHQTVFDQLTSIFFDLSSLSNYFNKIIEPNFEENGLEIRLLNGTEIEKYYYISDMENGEKIRIGRKDENFKTNNENIEVPALLKGVSRISKPHAWLKFENNNYYIIDNETNSKTRVNMEEIESNKEIKINNGDGIRLGSGEKGAQMIFTIK
ncbi:FHA domain-containing protein [Methanobrevibacter sp. DSM 116169]|uniref:FHA domain-containing protein n=1 Tax=Methanobrevibacter sp. DSM 116169 TaxID=3242727 RepID=UPI0038FC470A